ncbi:MAG: class I SAM-dependent methyltransferase [Planctomycetia bacterium]|nr:class I SAM-dependent methyltransferase [Planctomycetia bacterium]
MPRPPWNERYAAEAPPPWDTGTPDPLLVGMVESRAILPGRTLEVGCGTGTNAVFLAERGFDVLGVDIAPLAIERARERAKGRCRFETADFLATVPAGGPFAFVFDRGCFHAFDEADERERFARNVAAALGEGGVWLSLVGSTEGPPREAGPPRRSARDIANAVEPWLEIVELRAAEFGASGEDFRSWVCLARRRAMPAQASTRR